MKKELLLFLGGGLTFLCIGAGVATSTDILTVKPNPPKSVYIGEFGGIATFSEGVKQKYKQGYILKSYSSTRVGCCSEIYSVVMEKY